MNRLFVVFVVLVLGSLVTTVAADAPVEGRAGRAEVRFMQGMIDHHQMALDMATHCLDRAGDAVRTICEAVIAAQTPEIEQMQAWLQAWYGVAYAPLPMVTETGDHGDHENMTMDPPMTMGMFAGLNQAEGIAYDIAWLESMIDHHDDAIHMSERALRWVQHDELRALAVAIITAQSTEIRQLETLIVELSAG